MKKFLSLTLLSFTILSNSYAIAKEEKKEPEKLEDIIKIPGSFTGKFGFISDYTWRGIAQSNENGAIQGQFDYNHDSGFYLGAWASNVDFGATNDANLEVDVYSGYTFKYEMFDFNIGGIYYIYPGAESSFELDYYEYQTAVTSDFDVASVTGSVNYTPDFSGGLGEGYYYKGLVNIPLLKNLDIVNKPIETALGVIDSPFRNYGILNKGYGFISNEVGVFASIGRQTVQNNVGFTYPDYNDWAVGANFSFKGFDLTVQYVDTNIDTTRCPDLCDGKVLFSIGRAF
ncbi:MAG: TorF family putative porin [Rickettsiales bacterium]|nr:TorF family putative porin [Rickettsiales bacterium]